MFHVSITPKASPSYQIEFCHIKNLAATPDTWKKGKYISLDNLKINVFVKGDFSPEHRHDMERMAEMLQPEVRDMGMVEAFWELAGGDQYTSDSELTLVGQIIDGAKVAVGEESVEMELYMSFFESKGGRKK